MIFDVFAIVLYVPQFFFCFKVQTGSPEPSVMDSLMTALQEQPCAVTFFFSTWKLFNVRPDQLRQRDLFSSFAF